MEARELADRIVDALLGTFYQATHVEVVLARRSSKALDIMVLSNDESIGALNQSILQWVLFETVLETIDEALNGESPVASASSLEVKVDGGVEQDLARARTIFYMLNEKLTKVQESGFYPLNDLPWSVVARQQDQGDRNSRMRCR